MRSAAGYSTYEELDQGKLRTDDRSIRFAAHILGFGPDRHRDHAARGIFPIVDARYDVMCSCGIVVRVSHRTVARQEAHDG